MADGVMVTGLGIVSPLGGGVDENWTNLVGAALVAALHERFDSDRCNFDVSDRAATRAAPTGLERALEMSRLAATEAMTNAGLWDGQSLQNIDPERIGCTVSASKPFADENSWIAPDVVNDFVSGQFGLAGERRNVVAACATGAYSIALGASWIEQGLCDVVLAGSVEPFPHPLMEAGFRRLRRCYLNSQA